MKNLVVYKTYIPLWSIMKIVIIYSINFIHNDQSERSLSQNLRNAEEGLLYLI